MKALLTLAALVTLAAAPAPGGDDAQAMAGHEDWIVHQHGPRGQWCCDISDGRPAEVRGGPGHYEVFYAREHWPDGTDQWILVPESSVLKQPSPLLTPIAWIRGGYVFCIALPAAS